MNVRNAWLGWVAADATALVVLRPQPSHLARNVVAPHAWLARAGADGVVAALAGAALWLAAAWLAIGLLATALACLPGALGRSARAAAALVLPRFLHRMVAGSAGLGILLGPVVSAVAEHAPTPAPPSSTSTSMPAPTPSWPTSSTTSLPAPRWPQRTTRSSTPPRPTSTTAPPSPTSITPHPTVSRAPSTGPRSTPPVPVGPTGAAGTGATNDNHGSSARTDGTSGRLTRAAVTVQPDESLWLLAARRLGPAASDSQIAREWPRWYAANRAVIGDDPDLIRPGQVLHAPAASPMEGS